MKTENKMRMVETAKLVPYINNARTHSPAQIAKLRASIREFGFLNPVIIDGDCGIIAGHGRVLAAQEEGMEKVPWDEELLRIEIESLQGADFDVSLTGFREDEVTDLFAVREDPDDTGSNKEYDEEEFGDEEFAHECPRCGFKFN